MDNETTTLTDRWNELRQQKPRLRPRSAAEELGVSEAELLATGCGAGAVTRLTGGWPELIGRIAKLGEVLCLTRNDVAIQEARGVFGEKIRMIGEFCQVAGTDIDLRLFLNQWQVGFAAIQEEKGEVKRSLQFFDPKGVAALKVHLTEHSELGVYEELVWQHRSSDQTQAQAVVRDPKEPAEERPDAAVDSEALRRGWLAMTDTHEFARLLKDFGVRRNQALRLAPPGWAYPVELGAVGMLLEGAASGAEGLTIFVRSAGCLHLRSGMVDEVKRVKPAWLNARAPRYHLHLDQSKITEAWLVKKPTKEGQVTSLELFDAAGETPILFFGQRRAGQTETDGWRSLVESLPKISPRSGPEKSAAP